MRQHHNHFIKSPLGGCSNFKSRAAVTKHRQQSGLQQQEVTVSELSSEAWKSEMRDQEGCNS